MAIFHLSVKPISRRAGRSATAAAAYRAGCQVVDERTGEIHDYTRRGGVEHAELVLPDGATWAPTRTELWNAAELAERRKDACVAREHEVALPAELDAAQRLELVRAYAADLAARHGCAVDFAIHAPGREGDERNWHAHVLCTTRQVAADGLGEKCQRERAGQPRAAQLAGERERWASMANAALAKAGHAERVDHRSNAERGLEAEPTTHEGPSATAMQRRGEPSDRAEQNAAIRAGNAERAQLREAIASVSAELDSLRADFASDTTGEAEIGEGAIGGMDAYNAIERRKAAARQRAARQAARPGPMLVAPFVAVPAPARPAPDPRWAQAEQQPRAVVRRAIAAVLASEYNADRKALEAELERAKRVQRLEAELEAHQAAKPWAISPRLGEWREQRDALRGAIRADRAHMQGRTPATHARSAMAGLRCLEAHAKARSAELFKAGAAAPAVAAVLAELEAEEAERKRRQAVAAQLRADQADPKAARERQEARWAALREAAGPSPAEPNKKRRKPR